MTGIREQNKQSFRRAAASLATSLVDGGYRSVLFASATPGEGCTTVVHEIASQLAQEFGLHTLVIELDVEYPGYAARLGMESAKSLAAIASGEQAMRDCIQTVPEGYSLIPGHDPTRATRRYVDLATTLRNMLSELENDYDCILLDTPPISDRAEALRLGAVVPRLMLVVEAGKTRSEVIDDVKRQLGSEGIAIIGAVLNKHPRFIPNWIYRWLIG